MKHDQMLTSLLSGRSVLTPAWDIYCCCELYLSSLLVPPCHLSPWWGQIITPATVIVIKAVAITTLHKYTVIQTHSIISLSSNNAFRGLGGG